MGRNSWDGTRGILILGQHKNGAFRQLVRLAFAALLGLAATSTVAAQAQVAGEAVAPPGSRLAIVPPEGFVPSDYFAGFENPELGASILFGEVPPVAYAQLRGGFSPEALAARGLTMQSYEELNGTPFRGALITAEQSAAGVRYRKWLVVIVDPALTGIVTFTVPEAAVAQLGEATIRASALSLRTVEASVDPVDALGFTPIETERFRIANAQAGNTVLYAETPAPKEGEKVIFVISASFQHMPTASLWDYSDALINSIDAVEVVGTDQEKLIEVDDLSGYETVSRCRYRDSGQPCALFHTVALDEQRYFRFVGIVPGEDIGGYLSEFRTLTTGFKRKR